MNYSIVDLAGAIGATVACGVLLLLPGLALAHIADVLGFRKTRTQRIYAVALVTGCAVLPVLDSLLALADAGIRTLVEHQREVVGKILKY